MSKYNVTITTSGVMDVNHMHDIDVFNVAPSTQVYDDLRVSPQGIPGIGANSPLPKIVTNDGSATTGAAGEFNGTSSYATVPDYAALDVVDMSISAWIKLDSAQDCELIDRNQSGGWEFYVDNGRLYFSSNGSGNARTGSGVIVAGQTHHVVVTVNDNGSSTELKLYVDGSLQETEGGNNRLVAGTGGLMVGEYHNGGWNCDGIIDWIQVFNVVLTDDQVTEIYNSGTGDTSMPTGITEATDLVAEFGDSYTNTATLGSGFNMTGNSVDLVSGLIGVTSGSFGVTALAFPAGQRTEVFFSAQLPHSYKQYEDIKAHIHYIAPVNVAGAYVFGLEYSWTNIEGAIGNTTIITDTTTPHNFMYHAADEIGTLPGAGMKMSSVLMCRLFRQGDAAADTYPNDIYLTEFDFHFPVDTAGSRQEWIK